MGSLRPIVNTGPGSPGAVGVVPPVAPPDATAAISEAETRVSGRRLVAHVVDELFYALIFVFVVLGLVLSIPSETVATIVSVALFLSGYLGYFVLTQRNTGRSPGKRLCGIQVVDSDRGVPTTGALVRRTIPLLFEYFYVIGFAAMMLSPHRRRLGDRWGDTYVIRFASPGSLS